MPPEGRDRLLQRRVPVVAVGPVQVDVVDAQPAERGLECRVDGGAAKALRRLRKTAWNSGLPPDLGGDAHLVPYAGPSRQPSTEQLLTLPTEATLRLPERVTVRRVDPHTTLRDVLVEQRERRLLIDPGAEFHRTQCKVEFVHTRQRSAWSALQVKRDPEVCPNRLRPPVLMSQA